MQIKYFMETDTAFIHFSDTPVFETKDLSENIYVDIDENGNLVSMTIERAKETGTLDKFSYEEIKSQSA